MLWSLEKGSCTGHQSLEVFQISWKPNCAKIEGKKGFQIWDIVIVVHTGGKKVHFSKILPDCPRKKTFSLCGHDWEHM